MLIVDDNQLTERSGCSRRYWYWWFSECDLRLARDWAMIDSTWLLELRPCVGDGCIRQRIPIGWVSVYPYDRMLFWDDSYMWLDRWRRRLWVMMMLDDRETVCVVRWDCIVSTWLSMGWMPVTVFLWLGEFWMSFRWDLHEMLIVASTG